MRTIALRGRVVERCGGGDGIDVERWPAPVVAFVMASVSRAMIFETALGMTEAHEETLAFVEKQLRRLAERGPEEL
ncbi:hypothetical protein [Nocardia sp. alder85J]|uniref:hypothetical protein n=1 Tax=Nocardia sp. alder85J TaxID=2862949 RepID=UPI001CD1B927|nr:hypothetical protein [Nocardia sp. alder85J]MCX4091011.1 hypothetical protein [Nocardia sp. alder85J]